MIRALVKYYPIYIAFLCWSTLCVLVGIGLMTVTATHVCVNAIRTHHV